MHLQSIRIVALVVLFSVTYFVGIVPLYILRKWTKRKASKVLDISHDCKNDDKNEKSLSSNFFIQIMFQFGGGVLFCTIFSHLIPETHEALERHLNSNDSNGSIFKINDNEQNHRIPYVELAICVGFFAIFFLEQVMHLCLDRYNKDQKQHCNNIDINNECPEVCSVDNHLSNNNGMHSRKSFSSAFVNYGADMLTESTLKCSQDNDLVLISSFSPKCNSNELEKSGNQSNDELKDPFVILFLRGLVIISAFSIHSIFDGLSIGLQKTTSDIWSMFFAITTHKLVIAFVVGMELYDQSKRFIIVAFHMGLFSVMSPIGILIVIITEESWLGKESENNPVVILLTSIATGTLLYIVFFEVLQKERCNCISGLVQFTSVFVGFGVMLAVNLLLSE